MSVRVNKFSGNVLITTLLLTACTPSRQLAIDNLAAPEQNESASNESVQTKSRQFQPVSGFTTIDGDDYYVRLNSDFKFIGENVLKSGCRSITPSYEKNELTSALIFTIRNDNIKFATEATGFVYQSGTGKCNFRFDAKKLTLTPWIRLDLAKETNVDYSFYSSANSNTDVAGLVNDVTAASSLLSVTGVGAGVALMGQFAGQWLRNNQQLNAAPVTPTQTVTKNSSISHTLPPAVAYTPKTGTLNQAVFKVYAVAEGGINLFRPDTQPLGELTISPELSPALLLKNIRGGVPDARDLSWEEIGASPIKGATGDMNLLQVFEKSAHAAKPNLKPDWGNYREVESNCHKLKLVMKDLGFNKFDRNAVLYYFLAQSKDWENYNVNLSGNGGSDSKAAISNYKSKNFSGCLTADDYQVMKAMGLAVNSASDWQQFSDAVQQKAQSYLPLKSIERQLLAVLKNPRPIDMERQLFPLLNTTKNGDGTVLVQDHLGDFALEKLIQEPAPLSGTTAGPAIATAEIPPIPGAGVIITARQLAKVFSSLAIQDLSCARPAPQQPNSNIGIMLFTSNSAGPQFKGGAMEFEFASGKINRITFQLPTYRDFEQDLLDRPEVAGCAIDAGLVKKLH